MGNVVSIGSYQTEVLGAFVCPNWDELNNYSGDARYIGMYWDSDLSVVLMNDGNIEIVSDGVWLALLYNHPFSHNACSGKHPTAGGYWFVVDRQEKQLLWQHNSRFSKLKNGTCDSLVESLAARLPGVPGEPVEISDWHNKETSASKKIDKASKWFDKQNLH